MKDGEPKLTATALLDDAKLLLQDNSPARLRNAGRSLCDAIKLFLADIGGAVYGYDLVSNLSIKLRFTFLIQSAPKLKTYTSLVTKLDKIRNKTEHSDTFFSSKETLAALATKVGELFNERESLLKILNSTTAKIDLDAQRKLLTYFLGWLEEEFTGLTTAHKKELESESDEVKEAKSLLALKNEVGSMDLEALNENILAVREAIASIDEMWSTLDSIRASDYI